MTYSLVLRIRTQISLRDHYSAHHNISMYNGKFLILLYYYDLPCNLVPDFFICSISYHNPYVFTSLDFFLFLKCTMLIPESLLPLFPLPSLLSLSESPQTLFSRLLIYPSAISLNDSSSKTVSWIL